MNHPMPAPVGAVAANETVRPRPWYRLNALGVIVMLGVAATLIYASAGVQKSMRSGSGTFPISWAEFDAYIRENPSLQSDGKSFPGGEEINLSRSLHNPLPGYDLDVMFSSTETGRNTRTLHFMVTWNWTAEHREWGFPRPIYSEDDYSPEKASEVLQKVFDKKVDPDTLSGGYLADGRWDLVGLTINLVVFIAVVGLAGLLAEWLIRYLISRIMGWHVRQAPSPPDDTHDALPENPAWDEGKNR